MGYQLYLFPKHWHLYIQKQNLIQLNIRLPLSRIFAAAPYLRADHLRKT